MNEGWEIKRLGELCDFINGDRGINYPSKGYRTSSGIPFINAGHITSKGLDMQSMDYISRERFNLLGSGKIKKQDILFCLRGSVGKFANVDTCDEGAIASSLVIIRPKESVSNKFLMLYLQSRICADMIRKYSNGAAQPNLSANNLKNFIIPIPSVKEQGLVISILSDAFSKIDKAQENVQRNLQNAKELFQSQLHSTFTNKGDGWVDKKLSDVSLVFGRGKSKHRPRNDEKLYGGDYPFIQTGDVRNSNKFITQYSQSYNEIGLSQSKLWPKGTICITIAANIAETAILNFDSCFPDSMIGLVVDEGKADVNFAYYALQFLKSELQLLGKGSAQDNINMGTFEGQKFPFPSVKVQKQIVGQLDAIAEETKKLEEKYQQKLNYLNALKKSILQKAFSGCLNYD